MSKDSYWFRHDDNAGRGLKMRKMSHIYGHWGKGIYWDVVEILRSQDKYIFSSDESSLSLLSDLIGCKDESKFINWFNDCIRIGLFEIVNKSFFYCPPLTENMKVWEVKKGNGSKGGRPEGVKGEKTIFSISGKEILRHPVSHCAYLIYDKKLKQHKIGETSNLFKRRLSIKRPTSNIDIIDFVDLDKETCFEIETEVKKQFSDKNISGDWFYLNEEDVNKIIMIFNKKTKGKKYLNNTESLPNQKHKITEQNRTEEIYVCAFDFLKQVVPSQVELFEMKNRKMFGNKWETYLVNFESNVTQKEIPFEPKKLMAELNRLKANWNFSEKDKEVKEINGLKEGDIDPKNGKKIKFFTDDGRPAYYPTTDKPTINGN